MGAGEERVVRGGSRGEERNAGGRGETELLSAATALLIRYLFLHLPHLLSFSWLLLFVFLLMGGKEQITAAGNLCPDKMRKTL